VTHLYLDIETIPSRSAVVCERIAAAITPPGNITKAETIAAWEADKKPALVKEAIAKTSFDGAHGSICCIGWAFDGEKASSSSALDAGDEADALEEFFGIASLKLKNGSSLFMAPVIVGHNVVNFDIRFIWQRAIVLGVRVPSWFPRDPKPWGNDVFDTMTAFAGARGMIGMDRLCEALGLEGKGEVDGSMVADLFDAGDHGKIADYCRADVERTRAIHRRMMVAFGQEAA